MNTNYTDITILVDRSGSMSSIRQQTIDGINSFISEQKKAPDEVEIDGRRITLSLDEANPIACRLTLIQFASGVYRKTIDAQDVTTVQALTERDYAPEGGTPLIQSMCRAIDETGARLGAMEEKDRPGRVIFVTVTDGQETEHNVPKETLKGKTQHQTDVYKWQFIYLGANQDAISEAESYGISAGNSLSYAANAIGTTRSFESANRLVSSKRYCCSVSDMDQMAYTVQDREAQDTELSKLGQVTNAASLTGKVKDKLFGSKNKKVT